MKKLMCIVHECLHLCVSVESVEVLWRCRMRTDGVAHLFDGYIGRGRRLLGRQCHRAAGWQGEHRSQCGCGCGMQVSAGDMDGGNRRAREALGPC